MTTWRDVRPGDVLLIKGERWIVESRVGRGGITMRSAAGRSAHGTPDPDGVVTPAEPTDADEARAIRLVETELGGKRVCGRCKGSGVEPS